MREVERTQDLWEDVNLRVGQTNAAPLRDLVEQAARVQRRAQMALQAAEDAADDVAVAPAQADQHLRTSLALTLRARDMTVRAARQLREELSQEENARRTLERARQRFEQLRGDDSVVGTPMWDQARQLLEQARLQWRDGNFEQALRLAENAENVLETLSRRGGGDIDPSRIRAEWQRTVEQAERLRERVGDRRVPALEQAETHLRDAREALGRERFGRAAEHVRAARRLLGQVEERPRAGGDEARIERALERLDAQLERFRDRLGPDAPPPVRRLLDRATEERGRARRALEDGDEHVRAAADLLARIQKQLGRRG